MTATAEQLKSFFAMARAADARRDEARTALEVCLPILQKAIRTPSGQGEKVRAILKSLWNGEPGMHEVGLCDVLAGLDYEIGEAVLAATAARLFLAGDADSQLRPLLDEIFSTEEPNE